MKKVFSLFAIGLVLVTTPACWKKKDCSTCCDEVTYPAYQDETANEGVIDEGVDNMVDDVQTERVSGPMQRADWARNEK